MDGEIEPYHCRYYGEPNGCNSPIYGEHPKSAPAGNAAKLREAMDKIGNILLYMKECSGSEQTARYATEALDIMHAALATPPRNCDRFESENDAWDEFMKTQYPQYAGRELPEEHGRQIVRRYCSWLFENITKKE